MADALSRKPKGMVASLLTVNQHLLRELDALQVEVILPADQCQFVVVQVTSPMVAWTELKNAIKMILS